MTAEKRNKDGSAPNSNQHPSRPRLVTHALAPEPELDVSPDDGKVDGNHFKNVRLRTVVGLRKFRRKMCFGATVHRRKFNRRPFSRLSNALPPPAEQTLLVSLYCSCSVLMLPQKLRCSNGGGSHNHAVTIDCAITMLGDRISYNYMTRRYHVTHSRSSHVTYYETNRVLPCDPSSPITKRIVSHRGCPYSNCSGSSQVNLSGLSSLSFFT